MRCLYFLAVLLACLSLAYCGPLPDDAKPLCLPRDGRAVDCNHCLCPQDASTRRFLNGLFGTLVNFGSMSHKVS
ncbi:hypothetical protein MSG28_009349 [Choristoneura fumiferana]|uniref:Uncharacterized protein n=1 Tax=Choristoneura fumiferana TaxID=7141 RepID=A0ACC0KXQ3_CHOFU|nr:hypothetical protein MSG28_009349 [Choristoneura fumiferana]